MTKLIITLNAKDAVDIDTLKTDIAKALSVMDGVESCTVDSIGRIIPVFTGRIIKRKVDKLIYDGKCWEMMSDRVYPDWKDGNGLIYAYFDDLVFVSEEEANNRLKKILAVGDRMMKGGSDMARLKNKTTARYFEKGKYVKDGLYCWTKSGADFECKVECPYNERKSECDCHTAVSKDALDYINELEAKLADVVPKSEVEKIFAKIEDLMREWFDFFRQDNDIRESCAIMAALSQITELKKKYTEVNDDKTDNNP